MAGGAVLKSVPLERPKVILWVNGRQSPSAIISYQEPRSFQDMGSRPGRVAYILFLLNSKSGTKRQVEKGM